jgi:hypothetical protein
MATKHRVDSIAAMRAKQPSPQQAKLNENSATCRRIIETGFKSACKGNGLQPYRMNDDDQINLSGLQGLIILALMQDPTGDSLPTFSWQNANQVKCVDDWHYSQILGLVKGFGEWKTLVLKRQDEIKEKILAANTESKLSKVKIEYDDLLVFGGGA